MESMILPLVNGLAMGMILFVAAAGLTLIFGVLGILNFAQGGFFALGAFLVYSLVGGQTVSASRYLGMALVAALGLGIVGLVLEVVIFRRIQDADPITALLATFAALLVIEGAIRQVWGVASLNVPLPTAWRGATDVFGASVPTYSLVLIVAGVIVAAMLMLVLRRTSAGRITRAVAHDRSMSAALGINSAAVFTATFAIGAMLGGLGGAFIAPLVGLNTSLAGTLVVESFAVVIVGGLGSISGALVAALFFGVFNSLVSTVDLTLAGYSLYIGMALILIFRPEGLAGTTTGGH